MFRMILWKEWKENLWKLIFCGGVSAVFTIMLFRIRLLTDEANCRLISLVQLFIVPIVYSLDIFSGEMSSRTIYLLFKIPVPRWKIFFSKYIVCAAGIVSVFLISSSLMEIMAYGREMPFLYHLKMNVLSCAAALSLFTWFCAFGCQSRSEAGSLAAMFGIFIGWGIVMFWAQLCEVSWAIFLNPYSLMLLYFTETAYENIAFLQVILFAVVIAIACYRYVSIRRYL